MISTRFGPFNYIIPKSTSKDPHVPLNYRGISILSCVGKVFSGIINARVVYYCEENGVFQDEQNGFRKSRSCEDPLFVLTSIIRNRLSEGRGTFCAFIDMQKAFDWVDRDLLFYKLLKYNIRGKIYQCIKALYSHPLACIKVNNNMTEWFEIGSGVRQGDSLSPSLFGLFINDLISEIKTLDIGVQVKNELISILAFADDIVILAENEKDLQKMLRHVEMWCKKWRLKVNTDKTNVVHFRKKNTQVTRFNFFFDGTSLKVVDKYKYLGTMLHEHLDYNVTSTILAAAAGRALGSVISKFKLLKNVGYQTFYKMFHSNVVPIVDYCSSVWGYNSADSGNKIQYRAIRYFLGVHPKAPLLALEGDIGWMSCKTRHNVNMIRLWNRYINMNDTRLTKRVFLWDYEMCKNWCLEVKQIFNSIEYHSVFEDKEICDIKTVQSRLVDKRNYVWKESLPQKPKLRTYVKFKENIYTESYVKNCVHRRRRSLLAQFRLGILPLHIETGRFRGKSLEERVCLLCGNGDIENEIHFVCSCSIYNNLRRELYSKLTNDGFVTLSDEEKCIFLVQNHWKDLSLYIEYAWEKRTKLLYNM